MESKNLDRTPVASGRFYSAHAERLEIEIFNMVHEARELIHFKLPPPDDLLALVAPHAGYVFSGTVAASAFLQLEEMKPRKKFFIIGSSHHTDFNGVSIYNRGNYITPFGKVKVDTKFADELINKHNIIEFAEEAHAHEHCIEVMLPFIQYFVKYDFEVIPIVIAAHSPSVCYKLSQVLKPYFNHDNLFIISTDLSHYPEYKDAVKVDKETTKAILSGKPDELIKQLNSIKQQHIPNLSTSMCGWTSVLTLMYLGNNVSKINYVPILYSNSGNAKMYGDKERVVGYQSVGIYLEGTSTDFTLSETDKEILLAEARKSIVSYLKEGVSYTPNSKLYSNTLQIPCGTFVSLYNNEELRGCIGRMQPKQTPLVNVVAEVARSAAVNDSRFSQVTLPEVDELSIEISVLTPLKRIKSINEIQPGKHGIYIKKGQHSGTFLPQVFNKSNWTIEEYVGHCSRDKAGLGWDGWKNAELFVYEAIIIKEG